MDAHTIYADKFQRLTGCVRDLENIIQELSSKGNSSLHDIVPLLAPRESVELNLALAMGLISLLQAQMTSQGIDSGKHQLQREIQRLRSYMSKLAVSGSGITAKGHDSVSDDNS